MGKKFSWFSQVSLGSHGKLIAAIMAELNVKKNEKSQWLYEMIAKCTQLSNEKKTWLGYIGDYTT